MDANISLRFRDDCCRGKGGTWARCSLATLAIWLLRAWETCIDHDVGEPLAAEKWPHVATRLAQKRFQPGFHRFSSGRLRDAGRRFLRTCQARGEKGRQQDRTYNRPEAGGETGVAPFSSLDSGLLERFVSIRCLVRSARAGRRSIAPRCRHGPGEAPG